MPIKYEEVKRVEEKDSPSKEYSETHPAFGQISASRISRGGKVSLYGAASSHHPTSISITICRSQRNHDLSRDWFLGREKIIEVEMTSLQFADMLTHMNMGSGVPCTIRHIQREQVPYIPEDDDTEVGRIREGFEKDMRKIVSEERVTKAREELSKILEKKAIGKSDRKQIAWIIDKLFQDLGSNVPFVLNQFCEAAEKVQSEVKKELASFVSMAVEKAGIKALSNMTGEEQQNLLKESNEDNDGA